MGTRHFQFWPSMPRHLTPPATSLWFNLEVSATRFPDKTCVNFYDSTLTYAALRREAEQLAGFLQKTCGVRRGDRVALYLQNSPQFIIGYYAILRADAMVVPINPMNLTKEVGHIVNDSGARVLILAQDHVSRIEPLIGHGLLHAIVACYSDYLTTPTSHAGVIRRRAGTPGRGDAVERRRGCVPARTATPDDLGVMPYISGPLAPEGLRPSPPQRVLRPWRVAVVPTHQDGHAGAGAAFPRHRHAGQHESRSSPASISCRRVGIATWKRRVKRNRVTSMTMVPTMVGSAVEPFGVADSSSSSGDGGGSAIPSGRRLLICSGSASSRATAHGDHGEPRQPRSGPKVPGIPYSTPSRAYNVDTLAGCRPARPAIITSAPGVDGYWNNSRRTPRAHVGSTASGSFTGDLGRTDETAAF
jgi:fatty-acyl-CoA synthase